MPRILRCAEISHDDLLAGRWLAALDARGRRAAAARRARDRRRRRHCGYDRRTRIASDRMRHARSHLEDTDSAYRDRCVAVRDLEHRIHVHSPSVPRVLRRRDGRRARDAASASASRGERGTAAAGSAAAVDSPR